MPCYTDPPSEAESVTTQLREMLKETRGEKPNYRSSIIESSENLQKYTRALCSWCKANPGRIKGMSLELQMWWRDHQEEDVRHLRQEIEAKRKEAVKQQALKKLTKEERRALGLYE